jgi:hypothetical protein
MKGEMMLKVRFGIIIAVFVLFVSGVMLAQQDTTDIPTIDRDYDTGTFEQDANPWTEDLRSQLNLRDDQVTEINDIMLRYQRESATLQGSPETMEGTRTEVQRRYSTEIESILDDNQRNQWRTYSDTWWNNVNTQTTEGQFQQERDIHQDRDDQWDTERPIDTETDRDNTVPESDIR